jgi:nucleotide-binding universal stress UspA family protein
MIMKKILLPFDGSESAGRALNYVLSLAKENRESEVHLLYVADLSEMGTQDETFWSGVTKDKVVANGERTLEPAKTTLNQAGVPYQSSVAIGSPGNDIARYARTNGCDGIVMGTRGMSPMASFIVGSVAQRVMQHAEVPVTLVK